MSWRIGLRKPGREVVVCWGASNMSAIDAFNPTSNYSSGPFYAPVNLATPVSSVKFATFKEAPLYITGSPVTRTWGSLEPYAQQSGQLIHSFELALGRHMLDRGRSPAVLTYSAGGTGAYQFATGARKTSFESFVSTQLGLIGESYTVVAIVGYNYLADTDTQAHALAFGSNLTSIFTSVTSLIGSPAANAAWIMVEPSSQIVTEAGTWGPTALTSFNTYQSTVVANHAKYKIPTNAAAADNNDTGEDMTALDFSSIHPGSATQDGLGDRCGKILTRHVLQEFII